MNTKIVFVNNLRGIAAVLVVISHFFGVFYAMPDTVHAFLHITTNDSHEVMKGLYNITNNFSYWQNGPVGVSLFF